MKSNSWFYRFLHNQALKHKLYITTFESDTLAGKAFDVVLITCILSNILFAITESLQGLPSWLSAPFVVLEYLFMAFFTSEYVTRIYYSPQPRKYVSSFFSIIDLLVTLPLCLAFFLPGARYLLIIRAFHTTQVFRIFKLSSFWLGGERLLTSLKESSKKITVFFLFVVILVVAIGTLMYMIEGAQPNTQFNSIPNSIYWAIVTMTTVGYGDITPATALGKLLSVCVMLIGYTTIAVPTGIVSISMMRKYKKLKDLQCPNYHKTGHEEDATYYRYCGHKLKNEETPQQEFQTNGPRRTTS